MFVKLILYWMVFSYSIVSYGQFGPRQVVDDDASTAAWVFAADLDGDGHDDILSASSGDDTIAWYKNEDGFGNFGVQQTIANFDQVDFVHAADLDGDDDLDVIASSFALDFIFWYENIDGLGTFGLGQTVSNAVDLPKEVLAADLDGDDDLDLVSVSRDDNKLAWYENLDGLGDFGPQIVLSTDVLSAVSIDLVDIDGDLDTDILVTAGSDRKIYWFENLDGLGTFNSGNIVIDDPSAGFFISVMGVDIDGDDDIDVISAEFSGNRVAWYENLDGAGNFGPQQEIDLTLNLPSIAYAFDVDGDNDMDVLSQSSPDMKIVWYENLDGAGNFGPQQIVSTEANGPRSLYATDFDQDTDLDLSVASNADGTIGWFENLTLLDIEENGIPQFRLYPNPVIDYLSINTLDIYIDKVEIYDISGRLFKTVSEEFNQIDLREFNKGIFIIRIYSQSSINSVKVIKK